MQEMCAVKGVMTIFCNGERFVFPVLEVGQCQTISETLPNVLKPMRLRRVTAYTSVVTGAC